MSTLSRALFASLTLGLVATAGTARADDPDDQPVARTTTTTVRAETIEEREHGVIASRIGIAMTAGAGTSGFTSDTLRHNTEAGGNWDVRLTIGSQLPIALEASYIGSAQYLDTFGLNNDALLVGNGAQAAVRINMLPGRMVTPFLFGGAAWRHYTLTAVDMNTSNIGDSDDVLEIPMGAGVAMRHGGLMLDLRGEYRAAFKEDLVPSAGDDEGEHAPMNRWGATLNAGVVF